MVLIAAMAMFTAVGASAFVVRARYKAATPPCRALVAAKPRIEAPAPIFASGRVPGDAPRSERFDDERVRQFREARADGGLEIALRIYDGLDPAGAAAAELADEREAVADEFVGAQLRLVAEDSERHACFDARARLDHIRAVVADRMVPVDMANCIGR